MAPRTKRFRRSLKFYATCFSVLPPYTVLVDGNFLHCAAARCGLHSADDMRRIVATVLEAPFSLATTHAVLREMAEIGADPRALAIAKACQLLRVGDSDAESRALDAHEAMKRLIGGSNRHKYIVATQDIELKQVLMNVPGTPVIGFQQVVLVLDEPSQASLDAWAKREKAKQEPSKQERRKLAALASKGMQGEVKAKRKRKRRGTSGPNPLSVKRKASEVAGTLGAGKVRKRRRRSSSVDAAGEAA